PADEQKLYEKSLAENYAKLDAEIALLQLKIDPRAIDLTNGAPYGALWSLIAQTRGENTARAIDLGFTCSLMMVRNVSIPAVGHEASFFQENRRIAEQSLGHPQVKGIPALQLPPKTSDVRTDQSLLTDVTIKYCMNTVPDWLADRRSEDRN